ncbi:hypothetical protein CSUI_004934 [Cystoisospora suis]|uniref:Uncharacterized protein n=1 Tax=Cystoisospora suis TaxID=483139 RepID=A0A2C6KZR5_9APIC|nr:hypothetical protein CSUI_004934 [Cystoisospora suis]
MAFNFLRLAVGEQTDLPLLLCRSVYPCVYAVYQLREGPKMHERRYIYLCLHCVHTHVCKDKISFSDRGCLAVSRLIRCCTCCRCCAVVSSLFCRCRCPLLLVWTAVAEQVCSLNFPIFPSGHADAHLLDSSFVLFFCRKFLCMGHRRSKGRHSTHA